MKRMVLILWLYASLMSLSIAQEPAATDGGQAQMLVSADSKIASNKRLVYDFWREVYEGGHMERVDHYLAPSYIQHNPNVPTGREGFVTVFSKIAKPKPVEDHVTAPLIAILGDGDKVMLAFRREYDDPQHPGQKYTSTWFDMFRIADGQIAEHWDPAQKH